MENPSRTQTLLRQYLLGEMSEQEQDNLEEKYFGDDSFFGELLDVEDQLIEEYRRGRLSPRERERFERRFLTMPEMRRGVEFVSLLAESQAENRAANPPSPSLRAEAAPQRKSFFSRPRARRSIPVWTAAAATLIAALAGGWLLMNLSGPRHETTSVPGTINGRPGRSEPARQDRVKIEEELAKLQTDHVPAQNLLSFTLTRGASRSLGEVKTVTPDVETTMIEFTLDAGAESYAGYQARLQKTIDESDVFLIKGLESQPSAAGKSVVVRLPVARLETDDYQITLEGVLTGNDITIIGKYLFKSRLK
jgi:hypothetical protein